MPFSTCRKFFEDVEILILVCPKDFFTAASGGRSAKTKQARGRRRDSQFTADGILAAAFAANLNQGMLASGVKADSVKRSVVACAEKLVAESHARMDVLIQAKSRLKISKRSWDETPMVVRDSDSNLAVCKVLNNRLHFRYGMRSTESTALPAMAMELRGTDALSLLEGLARSLPLVSIGKLRSAIASSDLFVFSQLMDQCKANIRLFRILCWKLRGAFHWKQECESHVGNLISCRPYDTHGIVGGIYCMTKLLRMKAQRVTLDI